MRIHPSELLEADQAPTRDNSKRLSRWQLAAGAAAFALAANTVAAGCTELARSQDEASQIQPETNNLVQLDIEGGTEVYASIDDLNSDTPYVLGTMDKYTILKLGGQQTYKYYDPNAYSGIGINAKTFQDQTGIDTTEDSDGIVWVRDNDDGAYATYNFSNVDQIG